MAFTIDRSALHQPLGFASGAGAPATARGVLLGGGAAAGELDETRLAEEIAAVARTLGALRAASMGAPLDSRFGAALHLLRAGIPDPTLPMAVASGRGIVDGYGVSVLVLASGRMAPPGSRTALQVTIATDARLDSAPLELLLRTTFDRSFATIAGLAAPHPDDRVLALASGLTGMGPLAPDSMGSRTLLVGCVAIAQAATHTLLQHAFPPHSAHLLQISVTGASDADEAAATAEALARDSTIGGAIPTTITAGDLEAAVRRLLTERGLPLVRMIARHASGSRQSALSAELARGHASATRWTAMANPATSSP